jgi:hypothetical protein
MVKRVPENMIRNGSLSKALEKVPCSFFQRASASLNSLRLIALLSYLGSALGEPIFGKPSLIVATRIFLRL